MNRVVKNIQLDSEREYQLISEWKKTQDSALLGQLIKDHEWLLRHVANNYRNSGLESQDLIAEGTLGLAIALEKFDPSRNIKFSTYATYWIKSKINNYVWKFKSLVHISSNKLAKFLTQLPKGQEHPEIISRNKTDKIAYELFRKPIYSLDDTTSSETQWRDIVCDQKDIYQEINDTEDFKVCKKFLEKAMVLLDKRAKSIVSDRWFLEKPKTLSEIAEKYGITSERVRQIENQALQDLKQNINSQIFHVNHTAKGVFFVMEVYYKLTYFLAQFFQPNLK